MEENIQTTPNDKKSSSGIIVVIILVALVGVVGLMVINQPKPTTDTTTPTDNSAMTAEPTTATGSMDTVPAESDIKVIEVEAGAFYYKPAEIKVKVGDKVRIVMKSVDMMHDFNIDELNVKMPIAKSGETGTVEFTATKAGTFEYYCSVGQHRVQGQIGKLIVE